jgi:regulator of replication initiation timing
MYGLDKKRTSTVYLRQVQATSRDVFLNDTLNGQNFYVEMEVKDPNDKLVCQIGMSYEQFVRIMLSSNNVPVTLLKYRNEDGELVKEEVEKPDSAKDALIKDLDETIGSVNDRISDLKKDIYELVNSGKSVGKKKMEDLLSQIEVIESHYNSNISFVTQEAVNRVGEVQDNVKTQLSIAMNNMINSNSFEPNDFKKLIEGESQISLPDYTIKPIIEYYKKKERAEKSIDDMTNMELADNISVLLKKFETLERIENGDSEHNLLYFAHAVTVLGGVGISNVSYHGCYTVLPERAKAYLKFLISISKFSEFKTYHDFDK